MPYTKTNWIDGTTPITAAKLNNMENAIEALDLNPKLKDYKAWYTTSAGKTLASTTWTRLTFNVAKANAGGMYKTGDTFAIQKTGWHRFAANILVHLQMGVGVYVEVWKIGDAAVKHRIIGVLAVTGESWNSPSGEGLIYCTQGEEYEFVIQQTSSDSRPLNAYNCLVELV
ncbi:hypothetical protein [Bacillus sp. 1NLA3E]|uniref:hypothetical protein n=1 Tax=Bacillus sp. 1NLA3E TaxID=666686 RepID=UPI000247E647|nr:hypothetical protein [Bacillus sp. 1NLA3E]AGK52038.1 hypothetical protein B1NLA3E_01270 [Bacillus sp. 1NLA3E]